MKKTILVLVFVGSSVVCTGLGFWVGFREAWGLGVAAEMLPRGALVVNHLKQLKTGDSGKVIVFLESDVDTALVFGSQVLNHPLRDQLDWLVGIHVTPEFEKYARTIASYRKINPSPFRADFSIDPSMTPEHQKLNRELQDGAQEYRKTVEEMVRRYGGK